MKLHYYRPGPEVSNFGDQLNPYIWAHFFPGLFDEDDREVFFGIGTVLRAADKYYPNSKIIVFGSGAHNSGATGLPKNTHIEFVRGPLTARALGLPVSKAMTDPAILLPLVFKGAADKCYDYSYMPHYSVANINYEKMCKKLGINYIDPRRPVPEIIRELTSTKVMLCEAMHGAIVADAYGIPWHAIRSYASFNSFKWDDWTASLSLKVPYHRLPRLYASQSGIKQWLKIWRSSRIISGIRELQPNLSDRATARRHQEELLKRIESFKSSFNKINGE